MTPSRDLCEEPSDDMPPLVEPPSSMEYTFLTEMPPLSLDLAASLDATTAPSATIEELDSCEQSHTFSGPTRTYHGKRRDASYIPRPPNAFILFRSSFIREQQVPINVVGNHSNLSKIVGMFWNKLPRSERDTWEAKAVQAQVEHRRRYPDWRFQPGANAAANAKERRYVLDRGGGDGSGGGGKKRPTLRMGIRGTKDPPDRGGDDGAQEFQEEDDDEEVIDNDDDSDYEEGARSRRKGKGKRKVGVRARSTRGRRQTRNVESVEMIKPKAKSAPTIPRDKEKEKERIEKIVGFLVEGKKGAELEEAIEEWDKNGWKSSTAARRNVDTDKGEGSGNINQVDVKVSCDTAANRPLKFGTKPLPSIITVNPSPPSALSPMPAPSPHSPATSLLSPALTLSPTVPPPSSPELHGEVQGQVQGIKRSVSAPAPGMKFEVLQVQNQMQGQRGYMRGEQQVQLGYGRAPGMRKRNCSSASVPGSIGETVAGERNKEMQRRETVSLPLTRIGVGPRRWGYAEQAYGENQTGTVPDLVTQGFSAQGQGVLEESASMDECVAPAPWVGPNANVASEMDYYYLTSPASPPSAVQGQQTYVTTSPSWWPPAVSVPVNSQSTNEPREPVQEGSFEPPYGYEYPYSYKTSGETGYNNVYGDITQTFPVQIEQERAEYASLMQRDLEHEREHEQQWGPPMSSNPMESTRVVYTSSSSNLTSARQTHEIDTDASSSTDATVNAGAEAGSFFQPPTPSRISVPSSKFSSLTGWDGSKGEEAAKGSTSGSIDVGFAIGSGGVRGGEHGQRTGPWYGWRTIQSVGLGGGSMWDGDAGVGSGTSGREGSCGARGDESGDVK